MPSLRALCSTRYGSDETDMLSTHIGEDDDPYVVIITEQRTGPTGTTDVDTFEAGQANLSAVNENVPPADAITHTVTLPESSRHLFGFGDVAVTPFTLNAADSDVAIGEVAAGKTVLLVIERADVASFNIEVAALGATVYTTPGIHNLGKVAAQVSNAQVETTTTLTGQQTITGYALVGDEQELPSG